MPSEITVGSVGATILQVLKTGRRWRDTPAAYGPLAIGSNRYNRWASRGSRQRLFCQIAGTEPVPDELSIDSTHVTRRAA